MKADIDQILFFILMIFFTTFQEVKLMKIILTQVLFHNSIIIICNIEKMQEYERMYNIKKSRTITKRSFSKVIRKYEKIRLLIIMNCWMMRIWLIWFSIFQIFVDTFNFRKALILLKVFLRHRFKSKKLIRELSLQSHSRNHKLYP